LGPGGVGLTRSRFIELAHRGVVVFIPRRKPSGPTSID
jgi:hypothetical protein